MVVSVGVGAATTGSELFTILTTTSSGSLSAGRRFTLSFAGQKIIIFGSTGNLVSLESILGITFIIG